MAKTVFSIWVADSHKCVKVELDPFPVAAPDPNIMNGHWGAQSRFLRAPFGREEGLSEPVAGCALLPGPEGLLTGLGVDNVETMLFFSPLHSRTKEHTDLHRKEVSQAP